MYKSNCPNGALAEEQALRGYFYPLVNILGVQEVSLVVYSSSKMLNLCEKRIFCKL